MATIWYKIDNTKLTNAELRRLQPNLVAYTIARLAKACGWRFRPRVAYPRLERLDVQEFADLPRPARRALRDTLADAEDLGFRLAFAYDIECLGDAYGCTTTLVNANRTILLQSAWVRVRIGPTVGAKSAAAVISKLEDGHYLSTSNVARQFDPWPGLKVDHCVGATVPKLVQHHMQRLTAEARAVVSLDDEALRRCVLELHQRAADWNISRGVWVPLTDAEFARLRDVRLSFAD